ncbi:MAG: DUF4159 domain-containing protein [Planctomycetales bacterium]|nr:DUF4159 domain-containing protein [Planctomycetales bacterium]
MYSNEIVVAKSRRLPSFFFCWCLYTNWMCVCNTGLSDGPVAVPQSAPTTDAFTFVRIKYDSSGGYGESWYSYEGRDWQRWETDYPSGEKNLLLRLDQLTSLRVANEPIVLRLTDAALRDYPFIFMSDIGWQVLSQAEAERLSDYLEGGGFLWIDDFWGDAELQNLFENTKRLGSQWRWQTIPPDHEILRTVYPLKRCPQIPAKIFYEHSGLTRDPSYVHRQPTGGDQGLMHVSFFGLFDRHNRLCAIATHNTDCADGWEREGEDHEYFKRFSIDAYAFAINVICYAMTH